MASVMQLQSCAVRLSTPSCGAATGNTVSQSTQSHALPGGFVGLRRQPHSATRCFRWQPSGPSSKAQRRPNLSVRAADATFGGSGEGGAPAVFPRINVRDPYKRLGIDPEATSEELQEARNYLVKQYEGHEKSREAIEWAYDKIIAMKLKSRKKKGMNLRAGLQKKDEPLVPTPKFVRDFQNSIKVPATDVILKRLVLYLGFAVWSVLQASEQGPAFQLFVALATTVYFLKQKTQKLARSIGISLGSLLAGWFVGSVVPVAFAAFIPPTFGPEMIAAMFAYTFLWGAVTFLN